jgi:pilus assembly protein Flp/PilA
MSKQENKVDKGEEPAADGSSKKEGATLVEYTLLVALIALVVVAGAVLMGTSMSGYFSRLGSTVSSTAP